MRDRMVTLVASRGEKFELKSSYWDRALSSLGYHLPGFAVIPGPTRCLRSGWRISLPRAREEDGPLGPTPQMSGYVFRDVDAAQLARCLKSYVACHQDDYANDPDHQEEMHAFGELIRFCARANGFESHGFYVERIEESS